MIDYVTGGEFMVVTSNKGAIPYINTSNPITGMVAYDNSMQSLRVYDGSGWQTIGGGSATVNLTTNAVSILKWAEKKMAEEQEYENLAKSNATIKSLVDEMNKYKNQIEMVKVLLKSPGKEPTEMMGS
jgi:hypothetical protein